MNDKCSNDLELCDSFAYLPQAGILSFGICHLKDVFYDGNPDLASPIKGIKGDRYLFVQHKKVSVTFLLYILSVSV